MCLIKPDGMKNKEKILRMIIDAGFNIENIKMFKLSVIQAENFYIEHKEKGFFREHIDFMTSGFIIALLLSKNNAIADLRALAGDTNPQKATKGTIRNLYGSSIGENAVHGSDSVAAAANEEKIIFI